MESIFETLRKAIHSRTNEADQKTSYSIRCKPIFEWESYANEDKAMMTSAENVMSLVLHGIYTRAGSYFRAANVEGEQYTVFNNQSAYPKQQILLALGRAKTAIQNSFSVNGNACEFPALSPEPEQFNILAIVECVIGSHTASGLLTSTSRWDGKTRIHSIKLSDAEKIAPLLGLNLSKSPPL